MMTFVSKSKNPYGAQLRNIKRENINEQFISKSHVGTIYMFRNNTANITGEKVEFKHV